MLAHDNSSYFNLKPWQWLFQNYTLFYVIRLYEIETGKTFHFSTSETGKTSLIVLHNCKSYIPLHNQLTHCVIILSKAFPPWQMRKDFLVQPEDKIYLLYNSQRSGTCIFFSMVQIIFF